MMVFLNNTLYGDGREGVGGQFVKVWADKKNAVKDWVMWLESQEDIAQNNKRKMDPSRGSNST